MARIKGMPKTGGRCAGTPNKVTGTLKEFVVNLIDQNREQIENDLKQLEPKDRLTIIERLMGYVIPKQTKSDLQVQDWTNEKIEIVYVESGFKPKTSESDVDMGKKDYLCKR